MWEEVYGSYPSALIALTDTFTTTVFLKVHIPMMRRGLAIDPLKSAFLRNFSQIQSLHIDGRVFVKILEIHSCLPLGSKRCTNLWVFPLRTRLSSIPMP